MRMFSDLGAGAPGTSSPNVIRGTMPRPSAPAAAAERTRNSRLDVGMEPGARVGDWRLGDNEARHWNGTASQCLEGVRIVSVARAAFTRCGPCRGSEARWDCSALLA